MLVIVEGPDCVGKSTLVENIGDHLRRYRQGSVTVLHRGPPAAHPLDEYELPLAAYRPSTENHVICDRWHIGELVYPSILGRATQLTAPVLRHIELFLQARAALVVFVDASPERLRDCLRTRGDDVVSEDQVEAIRGGFLREFGRTTLPAIHLTSDDARDPQTIGLVVNQGEELVLRSRRLGLFVTYVGPRYPRLLLLGDVRARIDGPDDRKPAFMPYAATSGHYLLNALGDETRAHVGIANACDVDSVDELRHTLMSTAVVALGRNAARAAPWADRVVPHPQFVRRFHHDMSSLYRDAILGVRPWKVS